MQRWQWLVRLLTRRIWFRAALFCLFGVGLALAGALIGQIVPYDFAVRIGSKSVDHILNVLASSMLAVTTFSLSAMVSAYAGATSNITPRAVQLLIEDKTAQTALATFLGSFLFAIVGLIALSTGLYGDSGRVILFGGTIVVIALIVVTLVRWIEHVARFGRVSDTVDRVERAATAAAQTMVTRPRFGPAQAAAPDEGTTQLHADQIGRVTHVDTRALGTVAETLDAPIHIVALPGTLADPARLLAWTHGAPDSAQQDQIRHAFTLAPHRAFDHDPRFGLVVLSEIASRALSPAVNDPGTAISVLEAGTRVLAAMLRHIPDPDHAPPPLVRVPAFAFRDLLEDLYRPIGRDGAGLIEVGIRLQKSLVALAAIAPEARDDCRAEARDAVDRACDGLASPHDSARLTEIYRRCWPEAASG